MARTVIVGLDGSPESRAAAEWAAREAKLRGLPLKLVHVWEPVPEPMAQAPPSVPRRSSTGASGFRASPPRVSGCGTPVWRSPPSSSPAGPPTC